MWKQKNTEFKKETQRAQRKNYSCSVFFVPSLCPPCSLFTNKKTHHFFSKSIHAVTVLFPANNPQGKTVMSCWFMNSWGCVFFTEQACTVVRTSCVKNGSNKYKWRRPTTKIKRSLKMWKFFVLEHHYSSCIRCLLELQFIFWASFVKNMGASTWNSRIGISSVSMTGCQVGTNFNAMLSVMLSLSETMQAE